MRALRPFLAVSRAAAAAAHQFHMMTPVLLRPRVKPYEGPNYGRGDRYITDRHAEDYGKLSIQEATPTYDPTIELTSEEIDARVEDLLSKYNPPLYAYTMLTTVDVLKMMLDLELVPLKEPEKFITRWFIDPLDCIKNPTRIAEILGETRWKFLQAALLERLTEYDSVSPIVRIVKRYGLDADVWVPLMRAIMMDVSSKESSSSATTPSMIAAMVSGKGNESLKLPDDRNARVAVLAQLLIAAAQEYGRVPHASLALQILKSSNIELTFSDQKNLAIVVSRAAQRNLDWALRRSGALLSCAPLWLMKYFPRVTRDNADALSNVEGRFEREMSPGEKEEEEEAAQKASGSDEVDAGDEHDVDDSTASAEAATEKEQQSVDEATDGLESAPVEAVTTFGALFNSAPSEVHSYFSKKQRGAQSTADEFKDVFESDMRGKLAKEFARRSEDVVRATNGEKKRVVKGSIRRLGRVRKPKQALRPLLTSAEQHQRKLRLIVDGGDGGIKRSPPREKGK